LVNTPTYRLVLVKMWPYLLVLVLGFLVSGVAMLEPHWRWLLDYSTLIQSLNTAAMIASRRDGFLAKSTNRWLFPSLVATVSLAAAFNLEAMIIKSRHPLLHHASTFFSILSIVGMVAWLRVLRRGAPQLDALAHPASSATSPPKAAKFIVLLVPKRHREHLIGDLEEEYITIVLPEYGATKARLWYWWQVAISVVPLLWAQVMRAEAIAWLWKRVR